MATFQNAVLTTQGQALYSKAQSGTQLDFTRMEIGGGQLYSVSTTLSTGLASGTAYTSISVAALSQAIASGDSIVIGSGGTTQTVTASAAASSGATTISVNSFTANAAYASGVEVTINQNPANLTALITLIDSFSINSISSSTNNAYFSGIYENTNITTSTYVCEIGIFAQDPTAGEILYAYANAGANGDNIPPYSNGPESTQFKITAAVGNATSVTATIPADTYIPSSEKDAANGVPGLDANALIKSSELPVATSSAIGAVKQGTDLSIATDGTASVTGAPWSGVTGTPTSLSGYGITDAVNKTGDTMTGPLTLPGDPTSALEAVTKQYADTKLPLAGGTMTGNQTFDNNKGVFGNDTGGTGRNLIILASDDQVYVGDTNQHLYLQSDGTFEHNGHPIAQTDVDNNFSVTQTVSGANQYYQAKNTNYSGSEKRVIFGSDASGRAIIRALTGQGFVVRNNADTTDLLGVDNSGVMQLNGGYLRWNSTSGYFEYSTDGSVWKPMSGFGSSRTGSYSLAAGATGTILSLSGAGILRGLYVIVNNGITGGQTVTVVVTVDGVQYLSQNVTEVSGDKWYLTTVDGFVNYGANNNAEANISFESSLTIEVTANSDANNTADFEYHYAMA